MKTAKVFKNGQSQAVRLPVDFRFNATEVYIHKVGSAVILVPKAQPWQNLQEALTMFSDDFFDEPRDQGKHQVRKAI
jgi:antitoxin VapB